MYFEHIIYSAALAIIVGLIFRRYTGRDQAWVIIPISLLPDLDHINNIMWDLGVLSEPQTLISPLYIGLFHNILGIIFLTALISTPLLYLLGMRTTDAIIYSLIGLTAHLFEDYLVYPPTYHFLYPLNSIPYGLNLIPEKPDLIIAGSQVLIVGTIFLLSALCLRYYLMSNGWVHKKEQLIESEGI